MILFLGQPQGLLLPGDRGHLGQAEQN